MKNILNNFLVICLIITVSSCKQTPTSKSYNLEASILGLKDGTVIKLVPGAIHSSMPAVSETTSVNGNFVFKGVLNEPRFFYIMLGKNEGSIAVMLENSEMKLTAKAIYSSKGDTRITIKDKVLKGSKTNIIYEKETAFKTELDNDYVAYHEGIEELSKVYSKARQENNKKQIDSIENTVEWKSFKAREVAFFNKVKSLSKNIIEKHKDTWWGPFFMLTQYSYFNAEQKPVFEQFSEIAKNSYYGKIVKEELYPVSLIGTNVTNFNLNDKDGKPVSLKSIINNKKYVLIDFWASWCAPCKKEIPNLKKAYENFSSKGFEILSISIDKDENAWQKSLEKEKMNWPNLLDNNTVSNSFKVKTIPATFLIDEKGIILIDNIRGNALEEKLSELFN